MQLIKFAVTNQSLRKRIFQFIPNCDELLNAFFYNIEYLNNYSLRATKTNFANKGLFIAFYLFLA